MPFNKINNFIIGDDSTYNLSSFLEVMQKSYSGLASFDLMNFSNNGLPGIKAGAVIDVMGSIYNLDVDTSCLHRDSDNNLSSLSGAPDGAYYIMLVESGETTTVAAALVSQVTQIRDTDYNGYYEQLTTNRILGGFNKSGTLYSGKWRYQYDIYSKNYLKVTQDGLNVIADDIQVESQTVSNYIRARQLIPWGNMEAPYVDYHAKIWDCGVDYNVYYQLWDRCDGGQLELASDVVYKRGALGQYTSYRGSPLSEPSYTKFYLRGTYNIQVKYLAGSTSHIYYLVQVPNGDNPAHIRYSDAGNLSTGMSFHAGPGVGLNYTADLNGWYSIVRSEPSSTGGAELLMRISLVNYAPIVTAL